MRSVVRRLTSTSLPNGEACPHPCQPHVKTTTTTFPPYQHVTLPMLIARSARRLYHSYQAARFQSTSRHDGAVKPPVLHLERQPQPTVTTDDCHRTLRARQHGNRDLPLPPLLDEKVIAAKQKFTRPKAPEHEGEPTEFQQRLAANVYGMHCLASKP